VQEKPFISTYPSGKSMFRIAMISVHSCPLAALGGKETGGMNVYIRELSRELAKEGIHIDIFTRSQQPTIPTVVDYQKGVRVIHLKAGFKAPFEKNHVWFHLPEFLHNMQQFIREEKSSYNLIHSHYWLSGRVGIALRALYDIPLVHMFHTLGYLKDEVTKSLGTAESSIRLREEAQLLKHAEHIVVSSNREKAQMIGTGKVSPEKISIIPCGVDTHLFKPLPSRQSKSHLSLPDKRYILFVGRIDPVKGIDILLKAMRIVKDQGDAADAVRLLVIGGDGNHPTCTRDSELHKLKQLTADLGLSDMVTFLGPQKQELLPSFYAAAEMCVLPSRYESFGMVALEAMACGRPVIASNVGGLPSFIQDKVTGFLVPGGNETVLAEKILTLLNDAPLGKSMGKDARQKAKEFSWKKIALQMIVLYSTLMRERNSRISTLTFPAKITGDRLSLEVSA
jgi:D-inositol-3-phosphate glycosyltransferase